MLTVIYAEKPSAAQTVSKALNENGSIEKRNGYNIITFKGEKTYVTWGFGHLCELKQAKDYDERYKNWRNMPLPFIPCPYEIKPRDNAKGQLKIIYNLFKTADLVINATDYDREGELIFYYVYKILKCTTPFKRAHYSSLTTGSLKNAFDHLLNADEVEDITNAGRARSIADWVIGSNLTVAITLRYSQKQVLSVGRVQTPTLKILVDREKEIKSFKKEQFFALIGEFTTPNGNTYTGESKTRYAEKARVPNPPTKGSITSINTERQTKNPPHLYSQSALAMAANERFGFTLQQTLDLSQQLYEMTLTTYPRTDSQYLPEDMVSTMNSVLCKLSAYPEYKSLVAGKSITSSNYYFDNNKVSSHYAIVPTGKTPSGLNANQAKLYDLICRSVITMVCGNAVIEKTSVITTAGNEEFYTYGSTVITEGWLTVMGMPKELILPLLAEGETVSCKYNIAERETKPPRAFTDKSLIAAMIGAGKELNNEELRKVLSVSTGTKGIGTEATRAAIVEALIKRGYAERKAKTIRATDLGITLIDVIPIEDIKSPALTAEWEIRFDKIANGQESLESFLQDIHEQTRIWCSQLASAGRNDKLASFTNEAIGVCPKCGCSILKKKWGWGCSGWKKDRTGCDFGINAVIAGKKITDSIVRQLLSSGKTKTINGFKSKAGNTFSAKLMIDENNKIALDMN